MRNGRVNLYKLNSNGELTTPPLFSISSFQAHSAQFSPDSRFLAYSSLGKDAHVKLMEIQEAPFFNLIGKQKLNCPFEPMRPKSVAFSHDGKFVAIGYCTQLGNKIGYSSGMLALHRYQKRGWINPTPTSIVENLTSTETIAFHPRTATIVAVDQVLDRVTAHQYNPNSGEIETSWTILEGEVSELFLPHGLHFSQDGRFLAVTNYGDDKVTVYEASW